MEHISGNWWTSGEPYIIRLLIWVANHETSHILHINKNKSYRGHFDRLSVFIDNLASDIITYYNILTKDLETPAYDVCASETIKVSYEENCGLTIQANIK